jgi:pyruvate/2-oxoacid:ferredoxin oxidoreductase alpha subunit
MADASMIEIIKIIISAMTPIVVLIMGVIITKRIEKIKLDSLKEKEWQVKWADMFLINATAFNDNISNIITLLYYLQTEESSEKIHEIQVKAKESMFRISEIDWNIQNYTQFSKTYKNNVQEQQHILMDKIKFLISERRGNLEEIRNHQALFNECVRKAHSEILRMK